MGEYYRLADLDRKEFISSHDIGGVAKVWEWCAGCFSHIIPFMIARGADVRGEYMGRWAGDRVVLVGDYDASGLYEEMDVPGGEWTNISHDAGREFNRFIGIEELRLHLRRFVHDENSVHIEPVQ